MNILPRDKQIEIIAALCEGVGVRATARLAGVNRKTVATLALDVGIGCAELHDRIMIGIRVNRLELDELWSFVGKKQARVERHELFAKGDQYVFIGMAGTQKAIISYRVGKRDSENTDLFIRDLRERVLGMPEISSDGFKPYMPAIRDAFGNPGGNLERLRVYHRHGQPCLTCGTDTILQMRLAGRSTHWCPTCQPERVDSRQKSVVRKLPRLSWATLATDY